MQHFVIQYRAHADRAAEHVTADSMRTEGPWVVLELTMPVVGRVRPVVVRRLLLSDLQEQPRVENSVPGQPLDRGECRP